MSRIPTLLHVLCNDKQVILKSYIPIGGVYIFEYGMRFYTDIIRIQKLYPFSHLLVLFSIFSPFQGNVLFNSIHMSVTMIKIKGYI